MVLPTTGVNNTPSSWSVFKLNIETGKAIYVRDFLISTEREVRERVASFNRVLKLAAERRGATPDNTDSVYLYAPRRQL